METKPVSSVKNGTSSLPKPQSTAKYVADEFVTPKLSFPLLSTLNNLGNYYIQNNWDPINIESGFIELEGLHPTLEQLQVLEEVINYFVKELGGGVDSVVNDYVRLLKAKPTSEQLNLLTRGVKASSIEMYGIISAFTELVETKPHPHLWTIFDNVVTHHKFTNLDMLSASFERLSKANLSYNQIELLSDVVLWNIRHGRDLVELFNAFADFYSAKPSPKLHKIFEDAINYYKETGWEADNLVISYAKLAMKNPSDEALEILKDANEILKALGISLEASTNFLANSLYKDFIPPNTLVDLVQEAVDSKKFSYGPELSEKVSRLISKGYKNLSLEKLKFLKYLLIYREIAQPTGTSWKFEIMIKITRPRGINKILESDIEYLVKKRIAFYFWNFRFRNEFFIYISHTELQRRTGT